MNIIDHPELLTGAAFQNYLLETKEKGQLNQQIKLNKLSEGIILNELVSDVNILQKIPTLSSQSIGAIRPDTLCRFRGIVKDLYDIEFFCGHLHDPRTDRVVLTKYKDTIPNDLLDLQGIENDCQQKNIYARQPILLSSIPGESEWCQSRQTHPVNTNSNTVADVENTPSISHLDRANKRTLDISESSIVSPVNSSSKVRSDLSDMTTMQSTDPVTTHTVSPSSAHESVTAALAHSLNPSSSHVLAKVYDGLYDELRLNDMLEVIGIYTCDPTLVDGPFPVASDGDMDYNDGVEDCVDRLPASSLVPRLHCITLKRLGSSFPLLRAIQSSTGNLQTNMHSDFVKSLLQQCRSGILVDQSSSSAFPAGSFIQPTISIPGASDTKQYLLCGGSNGLYSEFISPVSATPLPTVSDMRELRLQCLSMLTTVLCGDALAAEYVLLALISRVYDRDVSFQGSDILLGHFPLLLSGFSKNDTHTQYILHRFVSQVTARSLLLPVDTISLLNGPALKPQRDSSMEFLQSSPLMLAADTTLILDETRESDLVSDQSEYQQVQASRQALLSVAEHQILPVQFPFHEVRLPVSTQLIMLTHSSRQSMFADSDQLVHVQLKPTSPAAESSLAQVTESLMDRLRMYFAQCRVGQATMLAETISMAEHDFISRNTVTRERNQVTESLSRVASDMMVEESEDDTTASPYESSSRLFHNWLTLVRLVALSQGDSEITPEHWVHMRALEAQRLNNLSSPLNIIGK